MRAPSQMFARSLTFALVIALFAHFLCAQETKGLGDNGSPVPGVTVPAGAASGATANPASPASTQPPPGESGKPGEPSGKPGEPSGKPGERVKPAEGPKPLQRPTKPETPPKPEELKIRPDGEGKIRLNFNGQTWPDVLNWLAEISGMSLDWQELPSDYLNLTTRRSYTVREVRDLINRHLLARGFTLLRQGEMLTVVDIKKLDTSLVPRVDPEDLGKLDPYEFVKVSFTLDWLLAETAARELKPMLSPNGKLTPMAEVNRIEAIDTATNLRDIHALLEKEQSLESQQRLVRKFKLQYARAADVRDELQTLLGIESKPALPGMQQPQNPDQAQQQAMMMARMQQQSGGQPQPGGPGQPGGGQPPDAALARWKTVVTLVANEHENSILATARPDKMAIIAQIIEALDVPVDHDRSLLGDVARTQIYRLTGIDPEPVVKTLQQIGNLSPTTRLEIDKKSKSIIAYAPLADQVIIKAVVEKLSGSERKFEVKHLRRLRADDVAGSILFMMGIDPKKKKERSNPWSWGQPSPTPSEKPNEFRVDADVEHNWLLLWANEVELGEVDNLLVKLGEISPKEGNAATTRVLDGGDPQETEELLERIRRAWPSVAPNPLLLSPAAPKKKKTDPAPSQPSPREEFPLEPSKTTSRQPTGTVLHLAELRYDAEPAMADAGKSPPPVEVRVGPDGKLIVFSQDPQALDLLEDLVAQLASPRKSYMVFHLKYASAYGVSLNLEDFFKEEKKEQTRWTPFWYDFGSDQDDNKEDNDRRLSKRRKLKFISDSDSNSILVEGADAAQLKTIEDLIKLYDQPPPTDSQSVRKTAIIPLRHSKAKVIAEAVKEVYRDLLSANDKALANPNQPQRESQRGFTFNRNDSDNTEQKVPKFKGLLSIGVDETSNSLVVSAPAFLFDHVNKMIKELDEAAAANNAVRVVKVGRGVTAARLHEVLEALQSQGSSGGSSASAAPPPHQSAAKPRSKGAKAGAQPAGHSSGGD